MINRRPSSHLPLWVIAENLMNRVAMITDTRQSPRSAIQNMTAQDENNVGECMHKETLRTTGTIADWLLIQSILLCCQKNRFASIVMRSGFSFHRRD